MWNMVIVSSCVIILNFMYNISHNIPLRIDFAECSYDCTTHKLIIGFSIIPYNKISESSCECRRIFSKRSKINRCCHTVILIDSKITIPWRTAIPYQIINQSLSCTVSTMEWRLSEPAISTSSESISVSTFLSIIFMNLYSYIVVQSTFQLTSIIGGSWMN